MAKASSLLLFAYLFHNPSKLILLPNVIHLTSLPCWGRVVIGSLTDYQSVGAGSNPVASTTVLNVSARSIGSDQKSCLRYAGQSLEKSRLFPILKG